MLKLLLDKEDKERAFVHYNAGDSIVLLVNNMGGMSVLEMYAIVDEILEQLGTFFWLKHLSSLDSRNYRSKRHCPCPDLLWTLYHFPQRPRLLAFAPQPYHCLSGHLVKHRYPSQPS